jgi:glutaredoxin
MDQRELVLYTRVRSFYCWRLRRLLEHRGYAVEVLDITDDPELRSWLEQCVGREEVPYVFVDHRPVGGFGEFKALEGSGVLEQLIRGAV